MMSTPNRPMPGPSPSASSSPAPVRVDELLQRCVGSVAVAVLLLEKFERQLHGDLRKIESGLSQADGAGVSRIAQGLKAAAGTVGAPALLRVAAGVEAQGRAGNFESLVREVALLRAEVERCIAYLPAARLALSPPTSEQ